MRRQKGRELVKTAGHYIIHLEQDMCSLFGKTVKLVDELLARHQYTLLHIDIWKCSQVALELVLQLRIQEETLRDSQTFMTIIM